MRPLQISCLSWLVLFPSLLFAEPTPDPAWQSARAHQPPGLHLKVTLPKDHYFQGERIEAVLDFSNDHADTPWSVPLGAGEPGGEFHARDAKGIAVINPRRWTEEWLPVVISGPVAPHPFGLYTLNLTVNETLRFDHPGVYQLYAQSAVLKGATLESSTRASLVSDPVTITIDPLTPDTEQVTLADARSKIQTSFGLKSATARNGIEQLSYLQTPTARADLIMLLGKTETANSAEPGLLAAPDPAAEAARILGLVQFGLLVPVPRGIELYCELKSYELIKGKSGLSLPEKEREALALQLMQERRQARQEIIAAMVKGTERQGAPHVEALWTAFEESVVQKNPGEKDADGGTARRAVAAHQLVLSREHVTQLLDYWYAWGSDDFLPLIQREAAPPTKNLNALIALIGLRPEEARPLVLKEFKAEVPRFLKGYYPASMLFPTVKPMPLPQLDAKLRANLNADPANPFPIIPVIACFGSPALLPDVLAAYKKHGDKWDPAVRRCLLLYWQRADPKGAPNRLEKD